MAMLILGMVLFFGCHSVSIFADSWRSAMVARFGAMAWRGAYSLVSLAGLVLIVWGYGQARQHPIVVYLPPNWLRYVATVLLLPALPLVLAATFPGRIRERIGHPMLTGVKLWAFAHLLVNGMLADLILFGGFLLWAGLDRASMARRTPRPVKTFPPSPGNDWIAVGLGLALYLLLIFGGHTWLIGRPVLF